MKRRAVGDRRQQSFTSLEMMAVTLTVMKVDDELKELVDADAFTAMLATIDERRKAALD